MNRDNPITVVNDHNLPTGDDHAAVRNNTSLRGVCPEKKFQVPRIQGCDVLRTLDEEEDPDIAKYFRELLEEGTWVAPSNDASLEDRPSWLDDDKLRRGQQCAQKFFFGISFAQIMGLSLLVAGGDDRQVIIFAGQNNTPAESGPRICSTLSRIHAWYTGDLWAAGSEARRHMRVVRLLHVTYSRRMRGASPEELARRTTLLPPLLTRGAADAMKEDFSPHTHGHAHSGMCPYFSAQPNNVWLNQAGMGVAQWAIGMLPVAHPQSFGMGGASDEELDALVYLWYVLGHMLGIEERFNFCAGGLDAVRKRSHTMLRHFVVPALSQAGDVWEHMFYCFIKGSRMYAPPISVEVALLFLCELVGVETPHVRTWLGARKRTHALWQVKVLQWQMRWALRLPPFRTLMNWYLERGMRRLQHSTLEKRGRGIKVQEVLTPDTHFNENLLV